MDRIYPCITWCFFVFLPAQVIASDSELEVALEKLEYLFEFDVSVVEVEAVYGNDESAFGIKVESEFVSGSYEASESQFYYAKPVSENFTGIVGARFLHLRDNDTLSAMLGFSATTVFDIDVELLTFLDDDFTEFRFEMERAFSLQSKLELVPKIELRAYSNDVEAAAVEARLIYTPKDRMGVYLGGAYIRVLQPGSDEGELTALAGLSYAW